MVVYQPELDAFRVDLTGLGGPVAVEWFDRVASVALLRCGSNHALSLRSVESAAKEMREQAITYLRWQTAVKQRFGNWLAVRAPVQGARGRLRIRGGFAAAILAIGALVITRRALRATWREKLSRSR